MSIRCEKMLAKPRRDTAECAGAPGRLRGPRAETQSSIHPPDDAAVQAAHQAMASRIRKDCISSVTNASGGEAILRALHDSPFGHGPNPDDSIEWWYASGHVPALELSFFAALFRTVPPEMPFQQQQQQREAGSPTKRNAATTEPQRGYLLTWAIIDRKNKHYMYESVLDTTSQAHLKWLLEHQPPTDMDAYLRQALLESLAPGRAPPAPDRCVPAAMEMFDPVSKCLMVTLGAPDQPCHSVLTIDPRSDTFRFVLRGLSTCTTDPAFTNNKPMELDITMVPTKGPVLHGRDGIVTLAPGDEPNDMKYAFWPRCTVVGSVRRPGDLKPVAFPAPGESGAGVAWFDHEWGGNIAHNAAECLALQRTTTRLPGNKPRWEWAAVVLDNDVEVSVTVLYQAETMVQQFAVVREGNAPGYRVEELRISRAPDQTFESPVTGRNFEVGMTVSFDLPPPFRDNSSSSSSCTLVFQPSFMNQEAILIAADPSFWEGHAHVAAGSKWRGEAVGGDAFLELRADIPPPELGDAIFEISKELMVTPVLKALREQQGPAATEGQAAASLAETTWMPLALEKVEAVAPELEKTSPTKLTAGHMQAVAAAVVAVFWLEKSSDRSTSEAVAWLDRHWASLTNDGSAAALPNDRGRLVLRAWQLRVVGEAALTPAPNAV